MYWQTARFLKLRGNWPPSFVHTSDVCLNRMIFIINAKLERLGKDNRWHSVICAEQIRTYSKKPAAHQRAAAVAGVVVELPTNYPDSEIFYSLTANGKLLKTSPGAEPGTRRTEHLEFKDFIV